MRTLLGALPSSFRPRGVVHVGAHRGEEVPIFREFGFESIALIEAHPDRVKELRLAYGGDSRIHVLDTALGESTGTASLLVHTSRTGSTEPASLLPLGMFHEIVPTLRTAGSITVPMTTLDALVEGGSLDLAAYNLLVVDVQGAESRVLLGATAAVARLDAIVCEVNVIPMYRGAPGEEELQGQLAGLGFLPTLGVYHELYKGDDRFVAWGECLFVRS
jgi:FkbM family methyltransferase